MNIRCFAFFVMSCFFSIVHGVDEEQNKHIQTVDIIIFSYNRPMQLYALLESIERYMTGVGEIIVVYRADTADYGCAYEVVYERFTHVIPYAQSLKPEQDFKIITEHAFCSSPSGYMMFAVDDIIVKDYVDLSQCVALLEETDAFGFYLRLGRNTHVCYPTNQLQGIPELSKIRPDVFSWKFSTGQGDWKYPHSIDMSIWSKKNIADKMRYSNYTSPTRLEEALGAQRGSIMQCWGLCYEESKIVNIPVNVVQRIYRNRSMHAYSPQDLLILFNKGLKVDISALYKINNVSAHMAHDFVFIKR